jgi:hypothetical protein
LFIFNFFSKYILSNEVGKEDLNNLSTAQKMEK